MIVSSRPTDLVSVLHRLDRDITRNPYSQALWGVKANTKTNLCANYKELEEQV